MTEKDLIIQDLRRENAELRARVPIVRCKDCKHYISVLAYMPSLYPREQVHECYIGGDGKWYSSAVHGVKSEDITHWTPLPQPPKGD